MSSPSHWQKICDDIVKSLNPDGATKFQFLTFLVKQFQDDNQEVAMVETNLDGRPTIVVQLCQEKQLSLKPLTNKVGISLFLAATVAWATMKYIYLDECGP
jgi:hypothetical protein